MTLKAYGEELKLDTHRVLAAQSFFGAAFEHGLSYKMDVLGVTELPPDKRIVIDENNNFIIHNTSLYYEEHFPEDYSEERYDEMLQKTKDEIIENCRAVFEHPNIDYVCSDLSGGGDTRLVLAAITNLMPKLREKFRVTTATRKELEKDYEIATKIAAGFELKWDDFSSRMIAPKQKENALCAPRTSKGLGISNEFIDSAVVPTKYRIMKFTGAYGELITMSPGYIYCKLDLPLSISIKSICHAVDIKQNTTAYDYAEKYISEVIKEAKSNETDIVYDYYYLHLGCRHHFPLNSGDFVWTPLMSKSGYHIKMMYNKKYKDYKLRFDLISALNPLLACFEYDKIKVNEEKEELHERLNLPTRIKLNVDSTSEHETFKEAIKRKTISYYPNKETVDKANDAVRTLYNSRDIHLSALKTFLDYSPDFDEIGFQLFCFFNKNHGEQSYHSGFRYEINRINRLLQIYWTIKIIAD